MDDHKGLPVNGYRSQSQVNVDLVNANKVMEEIILRVIENLELYVDVDYRWLHIGRTHIEQGFMAINRSIFRPSRIDGDLNV